MESLDISKLEDILCYQFENKDLLFEALRHSSYVNEQPETGINDNERLEFLGDAVLNLIISDMLMESHPDLDEGNLSKTRSFLVNETQLSDMAREIELGKYVCLGKGELMSNGNDKNSILADAFEAVIAAVYLDGGFNKAFNIIEDLFKNRIEDITDLSFTIDCKSRFQELFQIRHKTTPSYSVLEECGPDHDKTFRIKLEAGDLTTVGVGKTKKTAEQDAACKALKIMSKNKPLS